MKMKIEKYIFALRQCADEHRYDRTFSGQINVSHLCEETANLLVELDQALNEATNEANN